ncbi:hypothetical protein WH52_13950 [Tenacibaculum holothuriorum]|uniref:N-acetyltransferase domain-containing protein n=1 Tax=Tenacibaculum holothuriorum TaxID=1635173 RepID=A0A1Y2PB94_9FLAO|nr:GNAT family N-acetyltransferase [Tenacibaculum holothuriorum]OSY86998.1 hypothetical protein WH52_13950 [Tenacibaculum holothuriorum]
MLLESERLIIREAKVSDAPFYFKLFNDPDWIKYINNKRLNSIEETEVYLEKILSENKKLNGLGFYTVVLKENNKPIGETSALQREKLEYIDIGYAFLPEARGKGYATEATKLTIEFVRKNFNQKKVLAFTLPENKASQKLLTKLGFTNIGLQNIFDDEEDFVFEFTF